MTSSMGSVLIIDDEPQVRTFLRGVLEGVGHDVVEACDGEEGFQKFSTSSPDLVITDILLGGKEGFEAMVKIRLTAPEVKIIAISGEGPTGTLPLLDIAKNLGAKHTLKKPFEVPHLLEAVRQEIGE